MTSLTVFPILKRRFVDFDIPVHDVVAVCADPARAEQVVEELNAARSATERKEEVSYHVGKRVFIV